MREYGRSKKTSLVHHPSTTRTCESLQTLKSPPSMILGEATACPIGALTPASAVDMATHPAFTRIIILLFPTRAKLWKSLSVVLLLTKLCPWRSDW